MGGWVGARISARSALKLFFAARHNPEGVREGEGVSECESERASERERERSRLGGWRSTTALRMHAHSRARALVRPPAGGARRRHSRCLNGWCLRARARVRACVFARVVCARQDACRWRSATALKVLECLYVRACARARAYSRAYVRRVAWRWRSATARSHTSTSSRYPNSGSFTLA